MPAARWWGSLWTSPSLLIWYIAGGFCLWLPIWLLAPGSRIIISFPKERLWITAANYQMIIKNIYCLLRFQKTAHLCCLAHSSGPRHQPIYMLPLRINWLCCTYRDMQMRSEESPEHRLKSSRQSLSFACLSLVLGSDCINFEDVQTPAAPLCWCWLDLCTNSDQKERKKKHSRRALINYRSQLHTGLLELRWGTDGGCLNSTAWGWREQAGRG